MSVETRILIVEDEAIIAMDLRETLCDAGYRVTSTVASGEEALAICAIDPPDLVLMDVRLQGELNGIETAQLLRRRHAVPSVLLTAYYDPTTLAAAQAAEVFGYLIKPFDQRELCATLATALNRASSEKELQRQLEELRTPSFSAAESDSIGLKISTLTSPSTMCFQGKRFNIDHFPRLQREMIALILSAPHVRIEREFLEAELWPESPSHRARSSFDATLSRLRKLFNMISESSAAMDLFTLRNSVLAIENATIDLVDFQALDEKGTAQKRRGEESAAIDSWSQALALWDGEYLEGISSHYNILTVRQHNTQRVFEISMWLADVFAAQNRHEDQITALNYALRAAPTSETATGNLFSLLRHLGRIEQRDALLKQFIRAMARDGIERQEIQRVVRRIEQRAIIEELKWKALP